MTRSSIGSMPTVKTASDVAVAADKVFVNVPARRLQRAVADDPSVDGCGFGSFI
jgi:hypothetical protein